MTLRNHLKKLSVVAEFMREQRCNLLALQSYLDDSLVCKEDVTWLFILTFPNGGSTALAKLLLTASSTMALTPTAEGQWLVPSLCREGARWDTRHRVWARKLRAAWLNQVTKKSSKSTLVIEKSPPNLCRYREILTAFCAMETYLITFTRDPYATCASWHRRYGLERIVKAWLPSKKLSITSESDYFRLLGEIWLERASMLLRARQESNLNIRYEDFTDNTAEVIGKLRMLIPQLASAYAGARVKVKDYEEQAIVNMNEMQVKMLSDGQIAAVSSALSTKPEIVKELGYSIH